MTAGEVDLVSAWASADPEPDDAPEILNEPRHTAVHEAGHAVVGRKLGLDMGWSSVGRDEDSAGHCIVEEEYANLNRWWGHGRTYRSLWDVACARVVMLLAGAEAERVVLGCLQDVDGEHGDEGDRREAARLMDYHPRGDEGFEVRFASLRRAAGRLVRRHRADIEAVAALLQARGTVPGDELDAMVPGPDHGPEDPEWAAIRDAPLVPEDEREVVRIVRPS